MMVEDLVDSEVRLWKDGLVHHVFNHRDTEIILNILLLSFILDDVFVWQYTKSVYFSIKSAYHLGMDCVLTKDVGRTNSKDGAGIVWKILRNLEIPPKVRVFLYRLCTLSLPTRVNLQCRMETEFV